MHRNLIKVAMLLWMLTMTVLVTAQPARYIAGSHYVEIAQPVRTKDASKIEVVEVFWYGCPACYALEPLLNRWESELAADVELIRMPGVFNALQRIHAQAFYVAQNLGVLESVHGPLYDAIHLQRKRLTGEDEIFEVFAEHGVERAAFDRANKSFSVRTGLSQAENRMQDYGVQSTPNIIVNGKYLVLTNQSVRTHAELLQVVDYLIERERGAVGE